MSVQLIVVFISQVISIGFANNISVENLIDVDYESSDNTDRSLIVTKDGGPPVPTICMGELGCFPITPDFVHPKIRPINLTPWPRDKIKTRFMLYTETNPRDSYQLLAWNEKNLVLSGFDNRLPVKIIIPGWFDSRETTLWMQSMKDAFLQYTDVNVIIVEWTNLTPYMIAAANTRVVGAEVANVVNFLIEKTAIAAEQVHLIGHSLGAHIAGYAGQRVRHLGRITGLDPAKLMFQGMPASVTLDLTDANFVDIIHADPNVLGPVGYTESLGHIDFWPNGGSPQPGCFIRDRFFRGLEEGAELLSLSRIIRQSGGYGFLCSHQMAQKWFEKSIINGATGQCPFVGVKCANYQDFLNGQCSCDDGQDSCAVMGLPAEQLFFSGLSGQSAGSNWYLQTSLRQPFCFYQYQLVIKFKSDGNCYRGPGLLKLEFQLFISLWESRWQQTSKSGYKYRSDVLRTAHALCHDHRRANGRCLQRLCKLDTH
ncbi:Inactive pancreatic lipase-related protein 1 [Halotydeus destructor]|nr:Inactive pancreatic lipase-related protein 1 [Halotydeus destructor]